MRFSISSKDDKAISCHKVTKQGTTPSGLAIVTHNRLTMQACRVGFTIHD
jgi:hypothetical protein